MIDHIKQVLFSKALRDKHRLNPSFFSRERKLTFPLVVLFIANLLKGSLQDELDQAFKAFFRWDVARRFVTKSALSQARRKLSHTVFIHLLDTVLSFLDQGQAPLANFKGLRVFAIDGSTFRLHNDPLLRQEFGTCPSPHGGQAIARWSILHDVLNRITYDAILEHYSIGENALAFQHLEEAALPPGSVLVFDRNYNDFALLRTIHDQGHHFCVRLKSSLGIVKTFLAMNTPDAVLSYKPSKKVKAEAAPGSPYRQAFKVRLVQFQIKQERYILMTTLLDDKTFSVQDLADLYHLRWEVEESYKVKKCRMKIEDVSGLAPELVRQDFHAKIFSECLSAALLLEHRPYVEAYNQNKVRHYKISMTQVLAKMKHTLILLFYRENLGAMLRQLGEIFCQCLVDQVPGRISKRKRRGKNPVKIQTQCFGYKNNS